MLKNSDAWISCGFICLSGKNSIVYEACVSAKTSMGSAAPTQQGAGGGALLQTDIRMYPFAFSLAGLCAVEFRLHCPLGPASPESLSPGAGGHSPHTAPRRGARGARCAARGAPAAS